MIGVSSRHPVAGEDSEMIMELTQYKTLATPGFHGQEDFFFAYAQKTRPLTGPIQNGSVHLVSGNICYVSMNHFETATATK
jgi:hypothetical protein